MYICNKCHFEFDKPSFLIETHGLSSPPYEKVATCPLCESTSFSKRPVYYCKYCGARLTKSKTDYCDEICKEKNRKLLIKEQNRQKLIYESPVYQLTRETEAYNTTHNTNLSYGQYVTLVKCNLQKEKEKLKNQRLKQKKEYLSSFLLQQTKINRLQTMLDDGTISQEEFDERISACKQKRLEIEEKIEKIENETLREVLTQKYLCGKTLEQIALILNFSKRHTERLHITALGKFEL